MYSAGALASVMVHGPAVCEHCIVTAQLQPSRKPKREPLSEAEQAALFKAAQEWEAWLDARETSAPEGFIAARRTGMQCFRSFSKLNTLGRVGVCHCTCKRLTSDVLDVR